MVTLGKWLHDFDVSVVLFPALKCCVMWDIGIQLMKPIFQCADNVEFGSGMTINKNIRPHDHARRYYNVGIYM